MTSTSPRADGRTHYEAVLDIRYGMRFNALCERFYNRVDLLTGLATLVGGSAAAVAFVNRSPDLAAATGIVLAVASIFGRVLGAARKAEQHQQAKKAYAALDSRAHGLTVEQIDSELRPLQAAAPSGIAMLARPAYNANLLSAGRAEFVVPLGTAERALLLLA